MIDRGASVAMAGLVATDLTVAGHAGLAVASRSVARLQAFVDHAKVQISRRTRQLADQGDTTSELVLLDEGRLSGRDARANGDRDRVCETLPEFESALAAGDCTGGHLDALAQHTKDLSDDERADLHDCRRRLVGPRHHGSGRRVRPHSQGHHRPDPRAASSRLGRG